MYRKDELIRSYSKIALENLFFQVKDLKELQLKLNCGYDTLRSLYNYYGLDLWQLYKLGVKNSTRATNRGCRHSEESIELMRSKLISKKHTLEHNKKIGDSLRGRKFDENFSKKLKVSINNFYQNDPRNIGAREKIRNSKLNKHWKNSVPSEKKGKTYEEIYGNAKALALKVKLGEKVVLDKTKEQISSSLNPYWSEPQHRQDARARNLGRKLSPEACKKQSQYMLKQYASGWKPQYPKPKYVVELGHCVRSSYEEVGFLTLRKLGIRYSHEKRFNLNGKNYFLDCLLEESKIAIEFKGFPREHDINEMKSFKRDYSSFEYIVVSDKSIFHLFSPECYCQLLDINCFENFIKQKINVGILKPNADFKILTHSLFDYTKEELEKMLVEFKSIQSISRRLEISSSLIRSRFKKLNINLPYKTKPKGLPAWNRKVS